MALVGAGDLRAIAVVATEVSRTARDLHRAASTAAVLLSEGFVAGALLSALQLQKSTAKINFQLECDGALRGLFVESDATGALRGYVKNPLVDIQGGPGQYRWRPALGNSGFLSVLRDPGSGELFRSSVQLQAFDLPRDFERYFAASEQVETAVAIEVVPRDAEPIGAVGGVLLQTLPGGDVQALRSLRSKCCEGGALRAALQSDIAGAGALMARLLDGAELEITSRYPLSWNCPCSTERAMRALMTLGRGELDDMLRKDGKAEATCHFFETRYEVSGDELRELLRASAPTDP